MASATSAATMTAVAAAVTSEPKPSRPRWREFRVVTVGDDVDVYSGPGMTLDEAIRREFENFESSREFDVREGGVPLARFIKIFPDVTIWESHRVVALLRPQADGSMRVDRI